MLHLFKKLKNQFVACEHSCPIVVDSLGGIVPPIMYVTELVDVPQTNAHEAKKMKKERQRRNKTKVKDKNLTCDINRRNR